MSTALGEEIIGRSGELASVAQFLDCVRGGPAALLLEGEAGIGKTTLWETALELARKRSYELLACRPSEAEAQLSFAALGDLLDPLSERVLAELPPPQRVALEVALLLADPQGSTPDQRAVCLAFLGVLRGLAVPGPVLIAVDDVQWLDVPTAVVLEFALRRLEFERVGILVVRRSDGGRASPLDLDRTLRTDQARRLSVGPLTVGALHRLLRSRLGIALPRPALLRVHEASAGNPFYALEIARAVRRRGHPVEYGAPLPIPDTLRDLLHERLGGLAPGVQTVLQAASALSSPTVGAVTALAGQPAETRRDLEVAVEAGVIELEGERIRFLHPLLGSAAYSRMAPVDRRELHRRLSGVVEDPEEQARHLALSAESPDERVAAALDRAALHAAARGAPGSAAELSQLAARLTPPACREEAWRRKTAEARYLRSAADFEGTRNILEDLLEEMPLGRDRAEVLLLLAQTRTDDFEAVDGLCERALHEAQGNDPLLAEIEFFLGGVAVVRGHLALALERTRSASEAAERADDRSLLVSCLASVALYETFMGEATPGVLERAELLDRNLDRLPTVIPDTVRGRRLLYADRLDEARTRFEHAYAKVTAEGGDYDRARCLYLLALLELRAGRWQRAKQQAAEGYDLMEQAGGEQNMSALLYPKSLVDAHLGLVEEARTAAEKGVALSHEAKDEIYWIANQAVLGFLELSLGNAPAAAGHLRPLPERLAAMGYGDPNIYPVLPDTVEALIGIGELEAAGELLEELAARAERLDSPWALATSLRCRGLLETADGDLASALAIFERALAAHEQMQQPFERAHTLLALGRTRRRAKQKRSARDSLQAALTIFEELGARLWAENARAELQRIGGRTPASGGLTPSEDRVALLVAEGKTNREVAAAFYLSERTVEGHLSRIYAKLGVRSRAELAHRLAVRGPQKV